MNTVVTSKAAIVAASRELAAEQGLQALNMRNVAQRCNVAVGSVYNYFSSKEDLIAATIQDVWQDIFHKNQPCTQPESFVGYLELIFQSVREGAAEYPNFFSTHSMSFGGGERGRGRQVMEEYFVHMKRGLLAALHSDPQVRKDAFTDTFTDVAFVDFVFSSLLSLLLKQQDSCVMLCEIIRRAIY